MRAALRRSNISSQEHFPDEIIKFDDIVIDPMTQQSTKGDSKFEMKAKEVLLLQLVIRHDVDIRER